VSIFRFMFFFGKQHCATFEKHVNFSLPMKSKEPFQDTKLRLFDPKSHQHNHKHFKLLKRCQNNVGVIQENDEKDVTHTHFNDQTTKKRVMKEMNSGALERVKKEKEGNSGEAIGRAFIRTTRCILSGNYSHFTISMQPGVFKGQQLLISNGRLVPRDRARDVSGIR